MTASAEGQISDLVLEPVQQFLVYDAVDRSSALIFVADDEMRYVAVNSRACEVLGYTRAELLSLRVTDIAVAADADDLYREMMRTRSQQGDVNLRTKDGDLLPFFYSASEVRVAGISYWVSVGFVSPDLLEKVGQLETALLSRIVIEQAKGVIAGRHGLDLSEAFEVIRSAARSERIKLRDLSRFIVESATTPPAVAKQLYGPGAKAPAPR
jgi:PAS domain S-box-containing protein